MSDRDDPAFGYARDTAERLRGSAPSKADEALVKKALECYKLGVEAIQAQVDREKDDLRCQVPEFIWPDDVKAQRAGQIIAGIPLPPRPMISIPSLDQPVQLVLNQEKGAHLGVQIHPLSEDADDDTAEMLQGLYRRIEVDSRAGLARSWAYERAVKCGRGAYRVLTEYADDGGHFTDQKIVIKRLLHQESAVFDPFAAEPDWSDGRWAFITEWVPWDRYKRKYPESALAGYEESELAGLQTTDTPSWVNEDGAGKAVLVAEYFYLEYEDRRRVLLDDGSDDYEDAIPEGRSIAYGADGKTPKASRLEHLPKLKWMKMNGIEVLEQEDRDGKYIPIIPVIGRELQPFDHERRWTGIYGPNKEAARMLNYSASSAIELAALESKAPYTMVEGQQEGHEKEWLQANVRNFPYLLYKPISIAGHPAPPPQRTQVDTSRLGPSMMLLQMAQDFIRTGTGAHKAAMGDEDPANKTKGGILALQQQHEAGNSDYLDNLATISITYEAKVILDLIPHVYDRPGRVARVLDLEDNSSTVMLNAPFAPGPNKRPQMLPEGPETDAAVADPKSPVKKFDLKKGAYGIAVSVGKARESRIAEGSDGLSMLFQAQPALFQLLGDVWLKFQTWPGHQEAAERMKKMLPPPLQEKEEGSAEQDAQKLQQAEMAMQQMQQQMAEMAKALETEQVKAQAGIQETKIKADADLEKARIAGDLQLHLQSLRNAGALAVANINAAVKGLASQNAAQVEAAALAHEEHLAQQSHDIDIAQADADRQHQQQMAAQQHQQALEQGDQGQAHALMQGQQGAQNQAAQAEQAHRQALEQQAAQPPPAGNGTPL